MKIITFMVSLIMLFGAVGSIITFIRTGDLNHAQIGLLCIILWELWRKEQ
jgi:hypothetical protein